MPVNAARRATVTSTWSTWSAVGNHEVDTLELAIADSVKGAELFWSEADAESDPSLEHAILEKFSKGLACDVEGIQDELAVGSIGFIVVFWTLPQTSSSLASILQIVPFLNLRRRHRRRFASWQHQRSPPRRPVRTPPR
jgi:hypothetical protein